MNWLGWIDGHVNGLLRENAKILASWRRQELTTACRVKNFETWLLVHLVHRLFAARVPVVKTNGYLDDSRRPTWRLDPAVRGRKKSSSSISPDLSFPLPKGSPVVNVEIKTQTMPQEVLDDLWIVRGHNRERLPDYHACFVWVVIEPEEPLYQRRVRRSAEKIVDKAAKDGMHIALRPVEPAPWLRYAVVAPGL